MRDPSVSRSANPGPCVLTGSGLAGVWCTPPPGLRWGRDDHAGLCDPRWSCSLGGPFSRHDVDLFVAAIVSPPPGRPTRWPWRACSPWRGVPSSSLTSAVNCSFWRSLPCSGWYPWPSKDWAPRSRGSSRSCSARRHLWRSAAAITSRGGGPASIASMPGSRRTVISAVVWLAAVPLVAFWFHLVSPIGVLLNVPLISLTSLALLLGEFRAGWPRGIAPRGLPRIRTCPFGHTALHIMSALRGGTLSGPQPVVGADTVPASGKIDPREWFPCGDAARAISSRYRSQTIGIGTEQLSCL